MTGTPDYKKMSKTMKIYGVVQVGLLALLVYMAVNFQQKLRAVGRDFRFMHGVLSALAIQLLLFYPIYRFAGKEAARDLSLTVSGLTKDEMNALIKQKKLSDVVKIAVLGFFVVFVTTAPSEPFILSVIYYSFILTILTYLQCYNFAARKLKGNG